MSETHDQEQRRLGLPADTNVTPASSPAEPMVDGRGTRASLSTGVLLSEFGERVGRPVRRTGPALRRPLLPTAAAPPDGLPPTVRQLLAGLAIADPAAPTRAHAIARYATVIAAVLAPASELARIRHAALLCNIGLAAVPHEILQKTEELTPAERQLIRRHPILGAEMLHDHADLADLILLVLHHHEDYDGGGYPYGLSGEWIPLGARVIRVAETYDALLQPRPYRPALSPPDALIALRAGMGRHFDSRCVTALTTYLARG